MNIENKKEIEKVLEWLIKDYDFEEPKKLLDTEHSKEIPIEFNTNILYQLENHVFRGRKLIRLEYFSVYFYPLAINEFKKSLSEFDLN